MALVEYGPFRPDVVGVNRPILVDVINAFPTPGGYRPVGSLASVTQPLPNNEVCIGAASFLDVLGSGLTIAGSAVALYELQSDGTWRDVTRTSSAYATVEGNRWRFVQYGDFVIATNFDDVIQELDLLALEAAPTTELFIDLAGSPPRARYMTVIGTQLQLGNVATGPAPADQFPRQVNWSEINNQRGWEPAVNSAGLQDFEDGGPIQALIGGDVSFVVQTKGMRRQIARPESELIFQFDKIENERGTLSPDSVIHHGRSFFYLGRTGFFRFDIDANRSTQVGADKVDRFFRGNQRTGTNLLVYAAIDPINHYVFWSYISTDNSGTVPDRIIGLDFINGEWGKANITVTSFLEFITEKVDLDSLGQFSPQDGEVGGMEGLVFSLDSDFWAGGAIILGVFGTDNKMSNLTGPLLEATFETGDFQPVDQSRAFVSGVSPIVESEKAFVAVSAREKLSDKVVFKTEESVNSFGLAPAHASGRYLRARTRIPAAETWFLSQGIDPEIQSDGVR